MNKLLIARMCIGFTGIPVILSIWELLPSMKTYQLISIIIAGVLYNIGYWTLDSYKEQNGKK